MSRFDERDTQLEPSKSGVLGLVCAALGRDREEDIRDLAALRMGVRVDREGILMRDFQTVGGDRDSSKRTLFEASGVVTNRTIVSPRFYLADAAFLVGLQGETELLQQIHLALAAPVWPLCLGRKSFVPSCPVCLPDGLKIDQTIAEVFARYPRLCIPRKADEGKALRFLMEDLSDGFVRLDQPIAPFSKRLFGPRFIRTETINVSNEVIA